MGTFADAQTFNRRIRIRPCLGSSDYELWDNVERRAVSRKVFHTYTEAFLARCVVEKGYDPHVTRR